MKEFFKKLIKNPFVINILAMAVVTIVLIFATLKWLEHYTHHNQAVIVPDVKGMSVDEAALFLKNNGLQYNIIDSVFSKDVSPGTVVEVTPKAGSKVKEGRILFVTINATSAQTAAIPEVADLSFRQAYALLKSRGFSFIETEYVPGTYKDLAISVQTNGRTLQVNEKVSLTAPLVLKVSSGHPESIDSLQNELPPVESLDSEAESWF